MTRGERRAGRLAWYLIDGLPLWLVEMAVAKEPARLPALTALQSAGRITGLSPLRPNCQTPPSLASLFTGTTSLETGLLGFHLPDFSRPDTVRTRRAFDALPSHLPLLWEYAAASGHDVWLSHIPYVRPARMGTALRSASFGFNPPILEPAVMDVAEARSTFGDAVIASLDGGWTSLHLPSGGPERPLGALGSRRIIDGAEKIVFTGAWQLKVSGTSPVPDAGGEAFMADGLQHCYRRGELGRSLLSGGTGDAERLLVETLRLLAARFANDWLRLLETATSGLVMSYQSALDLALHELAGFVAPGCAHCTPDREAVVWPLLLDLLADFDVLLARTGELQDPGDRVIVTSDHGMSPIDLVVRPNVILRERGWLTVKDDGSIDPAASLVFYHPADSGLVCVNTALCAERGIAPAEAVAALVSGIEDRAGRGARMEEWPRLESALAPPAWMTARHYLAGGDFVQMKSGVSGAACEPSTKAGEHVMMNGAPELTGTIIDLSSERIESGWAARIPTERVSDLLAGPGWQRQIEAFAATTEMATDA